MTPTSRETLKHAIWHVLAGTHPGWVKTSDRVVEAVIEALREPDEAMLNTMWNVMEREKSAREGFRAAIDTLREGRG